MATAGDGRAPYESSGAGGKFRKRPFRRSAPATPYERPPTALRKTNPGLLTKLVDPASRLIYAGAHKLFGVFRKRLPPLSLQGPPGINEEPQNVSQEAGQNNSVGLLKLEADQDGNAANISAATGISELEQMLKQKTFTRSEIQHLTALLHSRTTDSPSDYVAERNGAKPHSSPSPLLRLEASTSGSMKKHGDNRDNFHASVSTPFVSSKVIEEETPSPAELAKAYMGIRTTKAAPSPLGLTSQDSKLINNVTSLQKTPITSIAPKTANRFKGLENGFLTPRSRGRSAMYSMARTPYSRSPLNFNQKGIMSETTLTSSLSLKRRSSVLDDDFGSGGPLRRTRQKANLLLQSRDKRELGYTTSQQPTLLRNAPEENGHTTMRESTPVSIPAKSTQTATKIFQQLERLSPKSPTKLTSNMLHGQALRSLEKVDSPKFLPTSHDTQKSEIQHRDNGESTSRGKEEFEENGARKFPVPFNMLTTVNGDTGVSKKESAQIFNGEIGVSVKESAQIYNGDSVKESAQIVTIDDSTSKLPPEPPQKKRAFRMSAPEDSWELDDDDDDIHVNGHVSIPPVENNKPEASSVSNKAVSADIIESTTPPDVSKTSATVEATLVVPEVIPVAKSPIQVELKESEKATPPPQIDGFLGGNVIDEGLGFKFPTSSPSTFNTQTSVLPRSTLQKDKVTPTEKVSPFPFSANKLSDSKPKESLDPKPINSTSVFSSDTKNGQFKVSNKDENGNDQKLEDIPAATSASAVFSFASSAKNSSGPTMTPDSSLSILSSSTPFPASGSNTSTLFNNTTSNIDPASTSIATSSVFSTSAPPPVFSFGSAKPTTSMAATSNTDAINEKEPKSTINSSLFAATTTTTTIAPSGGGLFGFSSPAATSSSTTTTNGGALFGFSSPAATSSNTTTTNGGALFGFSSAAATSSSTTTTNGGALFGFSSTAATSSSATTTNGGALFGFSSPAATSSNTTTTNGGALFGFSSPAATSSNTTTTNGGALFGFSSAAATSSSTTTTNGGALFGFSSTAATSSSTTTTNGGALFGFSSPAATSSNTTNTTNGGALFTTTTTTASGGLFGFSSPAATSTATAQSQGSFFNAASGSQSNTQTSSPVTQAVPFSFSSSSSPFGSSAPAFGSSPSFGISSVPATSEGKSGNSTSGSTASIFGSSWQSPTSSVFSFGASSAPTPSSTTAPITFGAPNTGASTGSSMFSFTTSGPTKPSFGTPSQVFGNPAPAIANNNDQMSMEDSMAEDSMQTPSPVSPFGQAAPVAAPGFMFASATPAPPQPAASFQFGVQPNQAPPQNPFQSSSVEFNAGGGSFSLGSGGDKSGRRVVRINKSKNRRK